MIKKNKTKISARLLAKLIFIIVTLSFFSSYSIAQNDSTHFYFVQITDSHYDEPGSEERIEKVVDAVNNLPMKIECVVHTGDITQEKIDVDSTVQNVKGLFSKFKMPLHILPGNHDILWDNYEADKQSYLKHFDKLTTYQEYNGVVFLLIFSEPLAGSIEDKTYDPIVELERGLKKAGSKPVIVFHHSPSVGDFYKNKMHDGWKKEARNKWEKLLNQYNVKAVIAGHYHRDEHHWLGKVPLYISAPISGYWGRQLTYRIYEYKDGKVGYRTQYLQ